MDSDKVRLQEELKKMEEAAKALNKSMKGIGTNEDLLIQTLTSYTNNQRQLIKTKYLTLFGKTLEEDIKSEISGKFLKVALALLKPLYEYEAEYLRESISGIGTNEKLLIQVLCTKDADEIKKLRSAYRSRYNRNLDSDLKNEESGDLGRLIRSIASGGRAENHGYDIEQVKKQAHELFKAGQGRLGTDESKLIEILCSQSFPQLYAIFGVYEDLAKVGFDVALNKELSGDFLTACLTIYKCVRNKPFYFAELLHQSMAGLGTDDEELIKLLVTRSDIDLQAIKASYKAFTQRNLYDAVKSDCSGDYKKILLALIGKN